MCQPAKSLRVPGRGAANEAGDAHHHLVEGDRSRKPGLVASGDPVGVVDDQDFYGSADDLEAQAELSLERFEDAGERFGGGREAGEKLARRAGLRGVDPGWRFEIKREIVRAGEFGCIAHGAVHELTQRVGKGGGRLRVAEDGDHVAAGRGHDVLAR